MMSASGGIVIEITAVMYVCTILKTIMYRAVQKVQKPKMQQNTS